MPATVQLKTPLGGDVLQVLAWDKSKREATVLAYDARDGNPWHWVETYRDTDLKPAVDGKRQDELLQELAMCVIDHDPAVVDWNV